MTPDHIVLFLRSMGESDMAHEVSHMAHRLDAFADGLDRFAFDSMKQAAEMALAQRDELALIIATDTGTESAVAELQNQRDELLAALKKIATKCNLDMYGDDGSLGGYAYGIWNTANTAIASVKGGA